MIPLSKNQGTSIEAFSLNLPSFFFSSFLKIFSSLQLSSLFRFLSFVDSYILPPMMKTASNLGLFCSSFLGSFRCLFLGLQFEGYFGPRFQMMKELKENTKDDRDAWYVSFWLVIDLTFFTQQTNVITPPSIKF